AHRLAARHPDKRLTGSILVDLELELRQPVRTIQPRLLECLCRGQPHLDPVELSGTHGVQLDIGVQRLVESRVEFDFPKAQGIYACKRGQPQRCKRNGQFPHHENSPVNDEPSGVHAARPASCPKAFWIISILWFTDTLLSEFPQFEYC